jgi:hypothetical protein
MMLHAASVGLEVALAVAVQATGIGGPVAASTAWAVAVVLIVWLGWRRWHVERRDALYEFIVARKLDAPPPSNPRAAGAYRDDTLITYRERFARGVSKRVHRLRLRGWIGPHEEHVLNNPGDLRDIEEVWRRVTELERSHQT